MSKVVKIFTDGACRGNPGIGGWGAVLRYDGHEKRLCGAERLTTNNRMELTATINALASLTRSCKIELTTDSVYVQKGITEWIIKWQKRNWQTTNKKPVKNADLWRKLSKETQRHQIRWHWIKGHSGHEGNELADALANKAIDKLLKGRN